MDAKKHLDALKVEGSSGAVDGKNAVHEVTFALMSSMTDCMASVFATASMDVTLQVFVLQVDEQEAPGDPSTQPLADDVELEEVAVAVVEVTVVGGIVGLSTVTVNWHGSAMLPAVSFANEVMLN